MFFFFFSSRRRHTRSLCDWSSDVCSSDLMSGAGGQTTLIIPSHGLVVARLGHFKGSTAGSTGFRRSEERRVGKECRSGWARDHEKKNKDKERVADVRGKRRE